MSDLEPEDNGRIEEVMTSTGQFMGRAFGIGFALLILLLIVLAVALYLVNDHVTQPGVPGEEMEFEVPEGATGNDVAELLSDAGLVEHWLFFRLAMRLDDGDQPIKHGVHLLAKGLSPTELLQLLRENPRPEIDPDAIRITVPEGLTVAQTADIFVDSDAFLEAIQGFDPRDYLNFDVPSLEGFLMPNTYYFSEAPAPEKLIASMLTQFQSDYSALLAEFPDKASEDPVRLVIVASLIEEEARVDEERPIIAAVIYNRLERNRALQMDSTLQYALGKYGERLLNVDKEVDSPYNTYKRRGLPPGPISNPGVASIRAALAPADVKYLYFVSNADGKTHTFSNNLREHEAAVAKFRREIRNQRREEALQQ